MSHGRILRGVPFHSVVVALTLLVELFVVGRNRWVVHWWTHWVVLRLSLVIVYPRVVTLWVLPSLLPPPKTWQVTRGDGRDRAIAVDLAVGSNLLWVLRMGMLMLCSVLVVFTVLFDPCLWTTVLLSRCGS